MTTRLTVKDPIGNIKTFNVMKTPDGRVSAFEKGSKVRAYDAKSLMGIREQLDLDDYTILTGEPLQN